MGEGEEMLARGSPAQRVLKVCGALEGSVPLFQGSSWIPVMGLERAMGPLTLSWVCERLEVTSELGRGRPYDQSSRPPTEHRASHSPRHSEAPVVGVRTQEPFRAHLTGMGAGSCWALSRL